MFGASIAAPLAMPADDEAGAVDDGLLADGVGGADGLGGRVAARRLAPRPATSAGDARRGSRPSAAG